MHFEDPAIKNKEEVLVPSERGHKEREFVFTVGQDSHDEQKVVALSRVLSGYADELPGHLAVHYDQNPSEETVAAWNQRYGARLRSFLGAPENAGREITPYNDAFYRLYEWLRSEGWYRKIGDREFSRVFQNKVERTTLPQIIEGSPEEEVILESLGTNSFQDLYETGAYEKYSHVFKSLLELEKILSAQFSSHPDAAALAFIRQTLRAKSDHVISLARHANRALRAAGREMDEHGWSDEWQSHRDDYDRLHTEIDSLDAELEIFKTLFKGIKETGTPLSLDEIKNLEWRAAITGSAIQPDDRQRMRDIYTENYASPLYSQEARAKLLSGLEQKLIDETTRFYVLKEKSGTIIGFNAFTDIADETSGRKHVYFSAFNVDSARYGHSRLGDAILDATLQVENRGKVIDAHCDSRSRIAERYLRDGFVASSLVDIEGIPAFKIALDPELNHRLVSKRTGQRLTPELIERLAAAGTQREYLQVIKHPADQSFPTDFFDQGFLLTYSYTRDDGQYLVFEKPLEASRRQRTGQELGILPQVSA